MTSRLFARTATLLALVAVLFAGQAQAQSSADVLQRLRAAYEGMDALRAQFTQEVAGARMSGTITLQGDRYRIETAEQTLVTDGRTAWAYSPSDNQVLVNTADPEDMAFAPNAFFTRYPDRFEVSVTGQETVRGARHDVLRLVPREQGLPVREVTMWVRGTDSIPTRVRVRDTYGTTMTFDLTDLQVNPRLAADTFRFQAPSGAEVIDLR